MTSQGNIARSSNYRKEQADGKSWPRDHSFCRQKSLIDLSHRKITANKTQSLEFHEHYRPR